MKRTIIAINCDTRTPAADFDGETLRTLGLHGDVIATDNCADLTEARVAFAARAETELRYGDVEFTDDAFESYVRIVMDGPNGAFVEYTGDCDCNAIDCQVPEGWTVDYSSQITVRADVFRAPLVNAENGCLYDADTNDYIDEATKEQHDASYKAGPTGIIRIDEDGNVLRAGQDGGRYVYVK